MEASLVPVCTVRVEPSSVIDPAGSRVPLASSASRMSWVDAPAAVMAATSGVMVTRCVAAPSTSASRTPSMPWMSLMVDDSSRLASSWPGRSLVTASWMTGRSSMLPLSACGSTLSGSCDEMRLMAWVTRCSAMTMSVP